MNAHGVAIEARQGRSVHHLDPPRRMVPRRVRRGAGSRPCHDAAPGRGRWRVVVVGIALWVVVALVVGRIAARALGVRTEGARGIHLPSRRGRRLRWRSSSIPVAFAAGGMGDWGGVYLRQGLERQRAAGCLRLRGLLLRPARRSVHGATCSRTAWDRCASSRSGHPPVAAAAIGQLPPPRQPGTWPSIGMMVTGIGLANNYPDVRRRRAHHAGGTLALGGLRLLHDDLHARAGHHRRRLGRAGHRRRGSTGHRLPLRRGSASPASTLPGGRHPSRSGRTARGSAAPEPAWPRPTADVAVVALCRAAYGRRGR